MDSPFLVFDLVGGEAGFQCECDAGCFVSPKLDDPEEAVGFRKRELSRFRRITLHRVSSTGTLINQRNFRLFIVCTTSFTVP
jgi:hypothetical protein